MAEIAAYRHMARRHRLMRLMACAIEGRRKRAIIGRTSATRLLGAKRAVAMGAARRREAELSIVFESSARATAEALRAKLASHRSMEPTGKLAVRNR